MRGAAADGSQRVEILRRCEFDHVSMTMSVVARLADGGLRCFCKGAPEALAKRCDPASLPADYAAIAAAHALQGYYVLGLAAKEPGALSEEELCEVPRTTLEANLRFLGLLLFRNELKPSSAAAIAELQAGGVRTVMLTGDNAQCAHYIARAAGLVAEGGTVLVATLEDEPALPPRTADAPPPVQAVRWRPMADGGDASAASSSLSTSEVEAQLAAAAAAAAAAAGRRGDGGARGAGAGSQPGEKTPLIGAAPAPRAAEEKAAPLLLGTPPLLELAVASSDALHALMASGAMARLLPHTRIWARTKPEDKAAIVSMFVELGMVSTMVGDGGNDCGALRSAHAGLALSEAEASVVSPFTSSTWSIRSVVDLVREGRAALATAFGSYKFLVIYGQATGHH